MTRVKICGITNADDAFMAVRFGADELGFNFYRPSPRYIAADDAEAIIRDLPAEVRKVGVFVNESLESIVETVRVTSLDAVQLHGDESPAFVDLLKERADVMIIKAFRVSPQFYLADLTKFNVDAVLLDAYTKGEYGGTGESFDWEVAATVKKLSPRLYLAGGLSELNVAKAIADVHPYCIDACSCLESEPGKKDESKLRNFLTSAGKQQYEF